MKLLGQYRNGTYFVSIYNDGTKVRMAPDDVFIPDFAENVDVQTSNRCNNNCSFCYAGCTPDGSFGKLLGWRFLESLHPYTEMALNLNFPVQDDFIDFLKYLKTKKVIANITVNQNHFEQHEPYIKSLYEQDLIHGLGVSLVKPTVDFINKIKCYPDAVIHVINGIVTPWQLDRMSNNGLKLLILGYKDIGRGVDYKSDHSDKIETNQRYISNHIEELIKKFKVISFDNLALEQINVKRLLSDEQWEEFYMGDDGTVTFFINLVDGYFAANSLSPIHYPIGEKSMDEMFKIIRGTLNE